MGARLGWRGAAWGGRACVAGFLAALALAVELVAVPAAWLGLRRLKHVKLF